jgi:predicted phage-related endonuclease
MKIQKGLIQGSQEWLEYRLKHRNASESSAVLGLSKNTTRNELLYLKSTGLSKEFSDYVQRMILDKGHEVEALARPIIEVIIGEDLYPVVCLDGNYSASCDGLTMDESIAFEHKQWNSDYAALISIGMLPSEHWPQCQHILMVTKAEKLIFVISDGSEEKMEYMWIYPDQVLQDKIAAGWDQFSKDRENYVHIQVVELPKAEPIKDLPAVIVQVSGALECCNINEVKPLFDKFLANAITDLVTDEDFAQAEAESKICRETAKRCDNTLNSLDDKNFSINEVRRELKYYKERFNSTALIQEKAVKTQKEARKVSAKTEREKAFKEHVWALQAEIKPIVLIVDTPDWNSAMKSQRLLSSLYGKLDDALADGKIRADVVAKDIRVKLSWFNEYVTVTKFLFSDLQILITNNSFEAFQSIVKTRIEAYAIAQAEKMEAERKRIQAEEQLKAESIQQQKLEADRAVIREEERAKASKLIQENIANAVTTAVTAQQIDNILEQKEKQVFDRKFPYLKQRPSNSDIVNLIADKFNVSYTVAMIWITDIATKQYLDKVA